jgi:integrase
MPRVATQLKPCRRCGGWIARKRVPEDVQGDYERMYGLRWEDRFHCGPMPAVAARAKHREWLSEIEARIHNIRAERKGEGTTLTPMQARGLAGEWYGWWTTTKLGKQRPPAYWDFELEDWRDAFHDAVWRAYGQQWQPEVDPLELFDEREDVRERVRPLVADTAEATQFLHSRRLTLDGTSRDQFLDYVCKDLFAAMDLLVKRAKGDYSTDLRPAQFPKFERASDPGVTPWVLFERWVNDTKPGSASVIRWRGVFLKLQEDFAGRGMASVTSEEAQAWADNLITSEREAGTVQNVWVNAARTVTAHGVTKKLLTRNPFEGVRVSVPKKVVTRPKWFTEDEIKTILRASIAVGDDKTRVKATRRWVPWLCAYTGARAGEITQLRGTDVIRQDGVDAINITPEAGTVKNRTARVVPIHRHLIEQGFLEFVKASGRGPLFYNAPKPREKVDDATKPRRTPYVVAVGKLGDWVRKAGVSDTAVRPNHAWRHTFKLIGRRHGIPGDMLDWICGHAQETTGQEYGEPALRDKAAALDKFPRYDTDNL